jgi:hypothetical protein
MSGPRAPDQGLTLLFDLAVDHGYFTDPARCQLQFVPSPLSAAWLKRAGAVVLPRANGLRLYCAADWAPGTHKRDVPPLALCFRVLPQDPLFGVYTDGLDPPAAATDAERDQISRCFDLADAPDPDSQLRTGWACCPIGRLAMPSARQGFFLMVPLPAAGGAAPVYRLKLGARAVPWKYLLDKEQWADQAPRISVSAGRTAGAASAAFVPAGEERLADGRMALAFLSPQPLPLAERAAQRIRLQSGGNGSHALDVTLPHASAANLARAGPGNPQLVAEILVHR